MRRVSSSFYFDPFPLLSGYMGSTEESPEIGGGDGVAVVEALSGVVEEVMALPENRGPLRRMSFDLGRRVKLLAPLFDELRDDAGSIRPDELRGLESLLVVLVEAKEMLQSVNAGSRLYQVIGSNLFLHFSLGLFSVVLIPYRYYFILDRF